MDETEKHILLVRHALLHLITPQEEVERALEELSVVLSRGIADDADDVVDSIRELCFSSGIVKALLGILRSSSKDAMMVMSCKCLSLLAHGSEESRSKLGEMDIIRVLVGVLHSYQDQEISSGARWSRDSVPICEQVMVCLRKITFHHVLNQDKLARIGGIKMVINLSMDKNIMTNFGQFSKEAKEHVEMLTLRKKFISRVFPVPDDQKSRILSAFPAVHMSSLAQSYPAFYVDLISKDKMSISKALVEDGLMWPVDDDEGVPESFKWTFLMVQAVEDGNSLWCQFCYKNQSQTLLDMKDALDSLGAPDIDGSGQLFHPKLDKADDLTVGETYLAYFSAPMMSVLRLTGEVPSDQWFRVRAVAVQDSSVKALAIDFGFTVNLPTFALFSVAKECWGIPPQAIPCKLRGVAPTPASISILENSAAVIRNMAFEKEVFCKEIRNFKGVEAMIRLARCYERGVVLEALGALVNLIIVDSLREYVGTKGAMELAVELLSCSHDGEVMKWAVGIILNGITDCAANTTLFKKLKGESVLLKVNLEDVSAPEREKLEQWIKDIHAILSRSESDSALDDTPRRPKASQKYLNILFQARRKANGERSNSVPVVRYLGSSCKSPGLASTCTKKPLLPTPNLFPSNPVTPIKSTNRQGSIVLLLGTKVFSNIKISGIKFFFSVPDIENFPKCYMKRSVCGIMNSGIGGSIWLGVSHQAVVEGFKITRAQKDAFCVQIDGVMNSEVIPPILSDQCEIVFYSLAFPPTETCGRSGVIPELCVVEIKLNGSFCHPVYTVAEVCPQGFHYNRTIRGGNEILSHQDVRDRVADEESQKYLELVSRVIKQRECF